MPYTVLYFEPFIQSRLLNSLRKMLNYPQFSFWIPITLDSISAALASQVFVPPRERRLDA